MKKFYECRYIVTSVASIPVARLNRKGEAYNMATKPGYGTIDWYSAANNYEAPVNRDRSDKTQVLCCDEDCEADIYTKDGSSWGISPNDEINRQDIPKQADVEAIIMGNSEGFNIWGDIRIFVTYDENGLVDNFRLDYGDVQPYEGETEITFEDLYPEENEYSGPDRSNIPGTVEYTHKMEQQEQEASQTASTPCTRESDATASDVNSSLTSAEIDFFNATVARVKYSVNVNVPIETMDHGQLTGKHKDALGICWAEPDNAGNPVPFRITIDKFFVHECYIAQERPYLKLEPETLEQVIAHEIAHLRYWRHGKKHTEFTQYICRLIEKGKPHGVQPHGKGGGDSPLAMAVLPQSA